MYNTVNTTSTNKPLHICNISTMHHDDDDRIFQRGCVGPAREGLQVSFIVVSENEEKRTEQGVSIIPLRKYSNLKRRTLTQYQAYKEALKLDADIYHLHNPDLMPYMLLLKLKGKRVVYDIFENYIVRFRNRGLPRFAENILMKLWRKWEHFVIKRLDGIVVVTESIFEGFRRQAKDHMIMSNMTDLVLLKDIDVPPVENRQKMLYVSGNNNPNRHVEELIMAAPAIIAAVPDAKIKIVGRYPEGYREVLQAKIDKMNLSQSVILEGNLPWLQNFNRTCEAQIGCVFWEKNENYSVTIPNRVFEYLFCGLAVLSEDTVELRKVIDYSKAGMYCDSSDPASIAEKAIYMLTHQEETIQMARNARKAVYEKLNFNVQLKELIALYERIMQKSPRA